MAQNNLNTWDSRKNIYNAIVLNTLLYGSPIWAINYSEIVERAQVLFFKKVLALPLNTPDYLVRLECGVIHLYIKF